MLTDSQLTSHALSTLHDEIWESYGSVRCSELQCVCVCVYKLIQTHQGHSECYIGPSALLELISFSIGFVFAL